MGRLENLVSGRQREFSSAEELLKALACDLASAAGESAASAGDA
jgi:hypothetical protein